MPLFTDQTGRTVSIDQTPQRIISLVPSQTELLYDLGLDETVVGITKFCVHPEHWFRHKQRVGGTKSVDAAIIQSLQPDLIIANKEENLKEEIEELSRHYPVWVSDISNLQQAQDMIATIGIITSSETASASIRQKIDSGFAALNPGGKKCSAAYLIWQDPYMSVGSDTFIHDMLQYAGFDNVFADRQRYPTLTIEDIKAKNPQYLLLSSEPFPFTEKHRTVLQEQLPSTKVILVDGEMFSWYGSRLLLAPGYFRSLKIADC